MHHILCYLLPVRLCSIFPYCLINGTISRRKEEEEDEEEEEEEDDDDST
jgi:hypothetical protein